MLAPAQRLGLAGVALSWALTGGEALAAVPHGVPMIEGAEKVGTDRYRMPKDKDWDKTVRFFRSALGKVQGVLFRSLATPPEVKAMHIENTNRDRSWDGINVYESGGDVFVFVLAHGQESQSRPQEEKRPSK